MERESPSDLNDEIEITPEMIEAGVSVLRAFHTFYEAEEVWAERIYRVMRHLEPPPKHLG